MLGNCSFFITSADFLKIESFFPYMIAFCVSSSWDPDQARHFIGPDLGPNCLQRLSADNKSQLVGNELIVLLYYIHVNP